VSPPAADGAAADRGAGWALIQAAQAGDRDAFGQLYAQYAGGVSRFVGNRLRDRGAVEDLTSETFARALRRLDSVTDQGRDVGAWFTTIARNLVLDHVKSSRHRLETTTAEVADADTGQAGPEQAVIAKETATELHRHVAGLPAAQQECIRRRFWEESSVAETAVAMDRREGAVKALQHRAIVALRAAMTGTNTAPVAPASTAGTSELPAQRGYFAEKCPPGDALARARRAVTEVSQLVAATDPARIASDRAQQLARWYTDDQTAAAQSHHQQQDRHGLAVAAEGGAP
jgi:RNA polymerase sigma-70 factor (ECF subfamily)